MTTTPDIYARLSEPFPAEMEKTRRKGGTELVYIPVSEVITRMNTVLGVENWNMKVVDVARDVLDPDFVVAHVRVVATIDGKIVERDGFGGQTIKRTKAGEIVDLGDEFKGAVSDAFKKACSTFGVALYLARSEEALEIEAAMSAPAAPAPEADPETAALYATLKTHLDMMDDTMKAAIKAWWTQTFPGERPPSATSTRAQLVEAIAWCVEQSFGLTADGGA